MWISWRPVLLLVPVALLVAVTAFPEQPGTTERASSQPPEQGGPPSERPEKPDDPLDGSEVQPSEDGARSPVEATDGGRGDASAQPMTYDPAAHAEAAERLPTLEEIQGMREDMIPAQQLARSPRQPATATDPWAPMFSGLNSLGGALAVRKHRRRLNAAIEERREGIRTAIADVSTWEGFEVMALQYGLSPQEILIAKELAAPRIIRSHRTGGMEVGTADRPAAEGRTSTDDSEGAVAAAFAAGVVAGRAEAGIATYSDYTQEAMKDFGGPAMALERARRSLCTVLRAVETDSEENQVLSAFIDQMEEEARFFECERLNEPNPRQ